MSTSARFTGAANKANTGSGSFNDYQAPAYAASIAIATKAVANKTLVQPGQLTGALSLTIGVGSATTPPMVGDEVKFLFAADGTNRVVTFSTGFATSGTLTVVASKKGTASFMFDGVAWVETG